MNFCANYLCEAEAVGSVDVSVSEPSDEERLLCACCEEAYTIGVQHGRMVTRVGY